MAIGKLFPALIVAGIAFFYKNDLHLLKPYLLLVSSPRSVTIDAWRAAPGAQGNPAIFYPPRGVPEIPAALYTYDALREATENFRYPAVVKGLFNGTRALEKWGSRDYLPTQFVLPDQHGLGDEMSCPKEGSGADRREAIAIPVVRDGRVGTLQNDRVVECFGDAFREVFDSAYTKKYLFFPVKSRFMFNGSAASTNLLQEICDDIARRDLDLDRIFPGFGAKDNKGYQGAQFVIGKTAVEGTLPDQRPTGSDWHSAVGNNYFVQVVGRKKWEFIPPTMSHYLWPLKGGLLNMWTGRPDVALAEPHIPVRYSVILEPGDMVFNPVWMWHKITNLGGLSIGVPMREIDIPGVRNNIFFSLIVFTNKLYMKLTGGSLMFEGYPPPSAATEADN